MKEGKRLLWSGGQSVYVLVLSLLFAACLVSTSMQLASHKLLFSRDDARHFHIIDFINSYSAARLVQKGPGTRIYDPAVQLESVNSIIAPEHLDEAFYFQYPPYFFLMAAPLAWLSPEAAFVAWNLFSMGVGLAGSLLVMRGLRGWSLPGAFLLCWMFLSSLPGCQTLHMGQQGGWLMVGLFCLFYFCLTCRRDFAAGIMLCLTTYKPQYVFFLLAPALAERRWRLVVAAFVFEVAMIAASGFALGFEAVLDYPRILFNAEKSGQIVGVHAENMVNVRGAMSALLPQTAALPLSLLAMVAGVLSVYLIWKRAAARGGNVATSWAFALTVLLSSLTSPHTHLPDCLFLIIPAMLTLKSASLRDAWAANPAALKLWSFGWLAYPGLSWMIFSLCALLHSSSEHAPYLALFALNAVMLIAGSCYFLSENSSRTATPG